MGAGKGSIQRNLKHWQRDPDLASVRDEEGLVWLIEDERVACRRLWAEVQTLLNKAQDNK